MKNKIQTINKSKGFTLIELLVVISIIGILATFIVASFTNAQARARDARRKSDLDADKKALLLYKNSNLGGFYPPRAGFITEIQPTYIQALPVDPAGGAFFYAYESDGNNNTASACVLPQAVGEHCTEFRLTALLETADDQASVSQSRCPIIPGMPAYTIGLYVVCND